MVSDPPSDVVHATSAAQLHAMSHPSRHTLLRAITPDGATISQLSNRLGMNKGNVAHHLAVLCRAGLARKGPTATVRGGTEQYFIPAARTVRFGPGEDGVATKAMLLTVAEEIGTDDDHLLHHRVLRLTRVQAQALRDHLDTVVQDLPPANPGEEQYGVLVSVYRRA